LNQIELNDELTAILVSLRYAIMTFCLVGLAKWFNRQQLSLVFGLWLTNEVIAHTINAAVRTDEYLYIISGIGLLLMTYLTLKYYRIDPIDSGLLVNE